MKPLPRKMGTCKASQIQYFIPIQHAFLALWGYFGNIAGCITLHQKIEKHFHFNPQSRSHNKKTKENTPMKIINSLVVAVIAGFLFSGTAWADSDAIWICNDCKQQYQGIQPPAHAKCPAKDMKQTHWWSKQQSTMHSDSMWVCNDCKQQYQGNQPPAHAKCPAKDMKQTHLWSKNSR